MQLGTGVIVKVLLRDMRTGFYYRKGSDWTVEKAKAFDLGQIPRAVTLAVEAHLDQAEILLCYDDPSFDLALPFEGGHGAEGTVGSVVPDPAEGSPERVPGSHTRRNANGIEPIRPSATAR